MVAHRSRAIEKPKYAVRSFDRLEMLKGLKLAVVVDEKVVFVQVHHGPAVRVEDFRLKRHKSHIQLDGELPILCRQTHEGHEKNGQPDP